MYGTAAKEHPGITGHTQFLARGHGAQWVESRTGRWEIRHQEGKAGGPAGLWTLRGRFKAQTWAVKERVGLKREVQSKSSLFGEVGGAGKF